MEWQDDAFVLSARAHGETGAIVELLTETHGRFAAHVAGAASRKMKPFLQPGARVMAAYRARTSSNLGSAQIEPVGEGPAALFDDPLALAGLSAAAAVAQGALPEREPHPGAFAAFQALAAAFALDDIYAPAVFVRFEAGLLEELGFGFDLTRCAATGVLDDLIYVSPRTGRAVSREAGAPYRDRMLALHFMLSTQGGLAAGDVAAGFTLTGHFLEQFVFGPLNRPLPPARVWLIDKLGAAGRL